MKNLSVIAPIKKPEDIDFFAKNTKCREFYVYHHRFMHNNFEYIQEFIDAAKKNNSKIYINFKHNITEEELGLIKKFIKYLCETKINGLFVNSYAILEAIKSSDLPFEVIIDSYFDIHNLSGIDFVNTFHKVHRIIITEDIYLKNILSALRPAVIALIIFAFYQIAALSLTSLLSFLIFGLILFLIYYYPE